MGKRKKPEKIKRLLAEADRDLSRGLSVADVCRKWGVSEATYHPWRLHFNAASTEDSRHVKQIPSEVAHLKELVAELLLDKRMLQDVVNIIMPPSQKRTCAAHPRTGQRACGQQSTHQQTNGVPPSFERE